MKNKINRILAMMVFVALCLSCPEYIFGQGQIKKPRKQVKQTSVKISQPDGYVNDHGYVDLGLSSGNMWATCNIGAKHPSDFGYYVAWGELYEKTNYSEDNCATIGEKPHDISCSENFDIARVNWGGKWRLPSKEDFQELIDSCTWIWCIVRGVAGYKVIGPNNNNIFLPAGDCKDELGSRGQFLNTNGDYWTSNSYIKGTSIYENPNNPVWEYNSYGLFFFNKKMDVRPYPRRYGRNVRPVLCNFVE